VYPEIGGLRALYVSLFGVTAVICFLSIMRARTRLSDPDTRRGLVALLATNGLWAACIVGRLVAPADGLKLAFYHLGLVTGLTTVGAWLYFCSAYAGESYHRERRYRWLALAVYLAIVGVKVTNPLHGLYFATSVSQVPFPHLAIELGLLHWSVTGLAYVLSGVGFYMLFTQFSHSRYATTRLGLIVALAGLPVGFNLLSYATEALLPINYESVGVALFALGVLYVAEGSFLAVRRFGREQLFDELDAAIVVLDADDIVRDVNDAACRLFPPLADGHGDPLDVVVPELGSHLPVDDARLLDTETAGETGHYVLSKSELTAGQTTIGQALILTDVTDVERQRRQIQRQQAQFDDFAEAITHELRNTLSIVRGSLEAAEMRVDGDTDRSGEEHIETALETTDRMTSIVGDLSTLARFARAVDETEPIAVGEVAREAWDARHGEDGRLTVDRDATVAADQTRLELLFERLFEFAVANKATDVVVDATEAAIVVTDDGTPLAEDQVSKAFAYGEAVPSASSGMALPVVRTIAESHGWHVTVNTSYTDGVRLRIET
jgi:signal transduction histidine kinase